MCFRATPVGLIVVAASSGLLPWPFLSIERFRWSGDVAVSLDEMTRCIHLAAHPLTLAILLCAGRVIACEFLKLNTEGGLRLIFEAFLQVARVSYVRRTG